MKNRVIKRGKDIEMIYVNITGGLGNQLFQYACARQLQEKYQQDIVISTYELTTYDKKRKLALTNFALNSNVHLNNEKLPWFIHRRNYFSKILRKLFPDIYFKVAERFGAYVWYDEDYKSFDIMHTKNIYLGGYWQSSRYSSQVINLLRNELILKESLSDYGQKIIHEMEMTNSVCVHIRRGDYVGSDYEVCTADYYNRAIQEMQLSETNIALFVFSDDIKWAKDNLRKDVLIYYIEENNPDYVDLYLMAHCNHFIISNSTFSWWAQNLGKYENKKVYAPSKWHKNKNCEEIYMPEWNIINVKL